MIKRISLLIIFLLSFLSVSFGNYMIQSYSYKTVSKCEEAKEKNNRLYPSYTRSKCYKNGGSYYYNICKGSTKCDAIDTALRANTSSSKKISNSNINTSTNIDKNSNDLTLSKCNISVNLNKNVMMKVEKILTKIDNRFSNKSDVEKSLIYGFYDYVLSIYKQKPKYRNNRTIQNLISYLQGKFRCVVTKGMGGNNENVDSFLTDVFGGKQGNTNRKELLKRYIEYVKSKKIDTKLLKKYISEYKYISNSDRNILLSYLNKKDLNNSILKACPSNYPDPTTFCPNGKIVIKEKDKNGCAIKYGCEKNNNILKACPSNYPDPTTFCPNGKIVIKEKDKNGCAIKYGCEKSNNKIKPLGDLTKCVYKITTKVYHNAICVGGGTLSINGVITCPSGQWRDRVEHIKIYGFNYNGKCITKTEVYNLLKEKGIKNITPTCNDYIYMFKYPLGKNEVCRSTKYVNSLLDFEKKTCYYKNKKYKFGEKFFTGGYKKYNVYYPKMNYKCTEDGIYKYQCGGTPPKGGAEGYRYSYIVKTYEDDTPLKDRVFHYSESKEKNACAWSCAKGTIKHGNSCKMYENIKYFTDSKAEQYCRELGMIVDVKNSQRGGWISYSSAGHTYYWGYKKFNCKKPKPGEKQLRYHHCGGTPPKRGEGTEGIIRGKAEYLDGSNYTTRKYVNPPIEYGSPSYESVYNYVCAWTCKSGYVKDGNTCKKK